MVKFSEIPEVKATKDIGQREDVNSIILIREAKK